MQKKHLLYLFLVACFSSVFADGELTGFWQTMDKKTNRASSVIAIYPYQGKYYGRIIGSYDKDGVIDDSIYHPIGKATGIVGHPYYSGLDFVWDAAPKEEEEGTYKGFVVDPRSGKVYRAELWREDENLILRGELFIFGRNEVWPPFPDSGFNTSFKKPDLSTFVPVIPKVIK